VLMRMIVNLICGMHANGGHTELFRLFRLSQGEKCRRNTSRAITPGGMTRTVNDREIRARAQQMMR